jgi:hypothetical protein
MEVVEERYFDTRREVPGEAQLLQCKDELVDVSASVTWSGEFTMSVQRQLATDSPAFHGYCA